MFMIIHFALQKKAISLTLGSLALLHFCGGETRFSSAPSVGLCPPSPPLSSCVRPRRKKKKQSLTFSTRRPSGKPTPPPKKEGKGVVGFGIGASAAQGTGGGGVLFCRKEETPARAYSMEKSCCSGKGRTLSPSVSYTPRPALLSSVLLWRLEGEGGKEATVQESVTHRDSPPKKRNGAQEGPVVKGEEKRRSSREGIRE